MAMNNEKIAKGKIEEMEAIDKCYRRCLDETSPSFPNRLTQDRLNALIEEGEVLIDKENKRVFGAIRCTSVWSSELFPRSHSFAKSEAVLEGFTYAGERIVYIDFLFVDPSFRRKGRGKGLLKTVFSRYEEASFLLLLQEDEPKEFFLSLGFRPLLGDYGVETLPGAALYVRPYSKTGICSDPVF